MDKKIESIISKAKKLAIEYYNLTGKPLGITSKVAEFEVEKILGIQLETARKTGYDAIWNGNKLQIKWKRKYTGKVPKIDLIEDWDYVGLLLLDELYNAHSFYIASRNRIKEKVNTSKSKSKKEGKLNISTFKSISEWVWLQGDFSLRTIQENGLIDLPLTTENDITRSINTAFMENLLSNKTKNEFTPEYHSSTKLSENLLLHLYKNANKKKRSNLVTDITKSFNEIETLKKKLNRKSKLNSIKNKLLENEILMVVFPDSNIIGGIITIHPIKSIVDIIKNKNISLEKIIIEI